jgi:hypothetical protein
MQVSSLLLIGATSQRREKRDKAAYNPAFHRAPRTSWAGPCLSYQAAFIEASQVWRFRARLFGFARRALEPKMQARRFSNPVIL